MVGPLDHKIGTFQKAKNRNFQKGLTGDLSQKIKFFFVCFSI